MGAGSFWVENLCLLFRLWLPPWGQIKIASIELVDLLWLDNGRPKKSVNFQFKSFSRYLYSVERFEINLLNVVRGGVMACTQVPGIFHSVIAEFGACFPRRKIRLDRRRESFFRHGVRPASSCIIIIAFTFTRQHCLQHSLSLCSVRYDCKKAGMYAKMLVFTNYKGSRRRIHVWLDNGGFCQGLLRT